jgi:hypothetical protein
MSSILTVHFHEGDIVEQLFMLKVSALKNNDLPALWRLTESLMELTLAAARGDHNRWPSGYVTDSRLFGVPVDFVRDTPHLLCDSYVVYPYMITTNVLLPH